MLEVELSPSPSRPLHLIERLDRPRPKAVRSCPVRRIHSLADADRDERLLAILRKVLADARGGLLRLRVSPDSGSTTANSSPPIARRRVNRAAAVAQHRSQSLDRAASRSDGRTVVDLFSPSRSKSSTAKLPAGAARALDLVFDHFQQPAMVREACERIRGGQAAHLIEQLGVIEQRSAQHDHVAQHHQQHAPACKERPARAADWLIVMWQITLSPAAMKSARSSAAFARRSRHP